MGNCVPGGNPEDREARSRSTAIDRQLREDRKEYENTIKILLLGKSVFSQSIRSFVNSYIKYRLLPCVLHHVTHDLLHEVPTAI